MDTKGLLSSKTVLGGVVALVPFLGYLLEQLGYLADGTFEPLAASVVSAIGGMVSIYGRLKVEKKIDGLL